MSDLPQVQLIIFPVNCNFVIKLTQSRVTVFLSVFGPQTVICQEIFRLCLAASYIRIPAAIAAFSDSTLPCIGILIILGTMIWMMRCFEAGKKAGVPYPETSAPLVTNFVKRDDNAR